MLISVLMIFSSPSFETEVSSRWRFFLMTSSSTVRLESLLEVEAVGLTLEPRERGVESLIISFEGVEDRDVESSNAESLKMNKKIKNMKISQVAFVSYDFLVPALAVFFEFFAEFSTFF